jgi:hypothetical protein
VPKWQAIAGRAKSKYVFSMLTENNQKWRCKHFVHFRGVCLFCVNDSATCACATYHSCLAATAQIATKLERLQKIFGLCILLKLGRWATRSAHS